MSSFQLSIIHFPVIMQHLIYVKANAMVHGSTAFPATDLRALASIRVIGDSRVTVPDIPMCSTEHKLLSRVHVHMQSDLYPLPPSFRPIYLRKVYTNHVERIRSFACELFNERHLERRRASVGCPLPLSFLSLSYRPRADKFVMSFTMT